MMNKLDDLEKRLRELDATIRETEKRLPAHSVKPKIMMELLEYEEEYENVSAEITLMKAHTNGGLHEPFTPVV